MDRLVDEAKNRYLFPVAQCFELLSQNAFVKKCFWLLRFRLGIRSYGDLDAELFDCPIPVARNVPGTGTGGQRVRPGGDNCACIFFLAEEIVHFAADEHPTKIEERQESQQRNEAAIRLKTDKEDVCDAVQDKND